MTTYAAGSARPDRWSRAHPDEPSAAWHAVEAHRPSAELDGEVELAVCGAIVHVEGSREWPAVVAGRSACPECRRITAVLRAPASAR